VVLTEVMNAFLSRFGHVALVADGVHRPEGFLARGFDRLDLIVS
jgi:hypothetical protein